MKIIKRRGKSEGTMLEGTMRTKDKKKIVTLATKDEVRR